MCGAVVGDGRVPGVVRAPRRPSTSAAGQRHFHHPSSAAAARTGLNHPRSIFRRHNHVLGFISSALGVNNSSPLPYTHTKTHTTHSCRGSFRQLLSEPNRKRTAEREKPRARSEEKLYFMIFRKCLRTSAADCTTTDRQCIPDKDDGKVVWVWSAG